VVGGISMMSESDTASASRQPDDQIQKADGGRTDAGRGHQNNELLVSSLIGCEKHLGLSPDYLGY
jgi:hypothetical protein